MPFSDAGKFSWELQPTEVVQIIRKTSSDPPEFHIKLGRKGDDTIPLTSTPKLADPINVPLPEISGTSSESQESHKFGSSPKVINKQLSPLTSRLVRLYKPMAKVMEKGDFRPSTAAKPLDRF